MKKKFLLLFVVVSLISIIKILIRKNQDIIPINMRFFRPNGSTVYIRTRFSEPEK